MMPSSARGRAVLGVVGIFLLAQLHQPDRSNPSEASGSVFDDPTTPPAVVEILERSCADCHSHQTSWPWYSYVAPASWLVAHDVEEGREHLNFSRWGQLEDYRRYKKLEEICEEVEEGEMPLAIYKPLHPEAKLSDADVRVLCDWAEGLRQELKARLDD